MNDEMTTGDAHRHRALVAVGVCAAILLAALGVVVWVVGTFGARINNGLRKADATTKATEGVLDRVDQIDADFRRILGDAGSTDQARSDLRSAIGAVDSLVFADRSTGDDGIELDVVVIESANGSLTNTQETLRGCIRLSGRIGDDDSASRADLRCPTPVPRDEFVDFQAREIIVSTGKFAPLD